MLAALITSGAVSVATVVLIFFLARQIQRAHDKTLRSLENGEILMKSNFELQNEVRVWKDAHAFSMKSLSNKEEELNRAIAARKVLEDRHAKLVLQMADGAPLDALTGMLQADLDKVHALSTPPPERLPIPLPAPSEDGRSTTKIPALDMASLIAGTGAPAPPVDRPTPPERPSSKGVK